MASFATAIAEPLGSAWITCGSCRPMSMKRMPLRIKVTICQTGTVWSLVLPLRTRGARQP